MFFDLFYVAAAYNLGNLLITVMVNGHEWIRGLAYFVGIFCGLYNVFYKTMIYESQFSIGERDTDYLHRFLEVVHILVMAFLVLHIKSIELLLDPSSVEMLSVVAGFFIESLIRLTYNVEVFRYAYYQIDDEDDDDDEVNDNDGAKTTEKTKNRHVIGDKVSILNLTKFQLLWNFIPVSLLYFCSMIISAALYYQSKHTATDDEYGDGGGTSTSTADYREDKSYNDYVDDYHDNQMTDNNNNHRLLHVMSVLSSRVLGGDEATKYSNESSLAADISIALMFFAPMYTLIVQGVSSYTRYSPKNPDIRSVMVPTNVDFFIHRFGEFTMLFFGEGVIALLMVDTDDSGSEYYTLAMLGVLNVVVLQAFKYECEPHGNPDGDDDDGDIDDGDDDIEDHHCLWRGMQCMFTYTILTQILCLGLIVFAVSCKVGLYSLLKDGKDDYGDNDGNEQNHEGYGGDDSHRTYVRMLGGADPSTVSKDVIALMYCVSLSIVLISIELMAYSHRGLVQTYSIFFTKSEMGRKRLDWKTVFGTLFKLGLLILVLTLYLWIKDLAWLAGSGLILSIVMAFAQLIEHILELKKRELEGLRESFVASIHSRLSTIR